MSTLGKGKLTERAGQRFHLAQVARPDGRGRALSEALSGTGMGSGSARSLDIQGSAQVSSRSPTPAGSSSRCQQAAAPTLSQSASEGGMKFVEDQCLLFNAYWEPEEGPLAGGTPAGESLSCSPECKKLALWTGRVELQLVLMSLKELQKLWPGQRHRTAGSGFDLRGQREAPGEFKLGTDVKWVFSQNKHFNDV